MLKIVNKIFSFKEIKFTPYKKVDLIFLEDNAINLRFNNLSCKVLDYKEINLYHLFVSVLSSLIRFKFSKKSISDFYFKYIMLYLNPHVAVGNEVDYRIFRFIKNFPDKKTILYQFAQYDFSYQKITKNNISGYLNTNKKIKASYFFIWHKKYNKYFDFFDTKFIVAGSLRSNSFPIKSKKKIYDIMFISQFRRPVKDYYGTNDHYLSMRVQDAVVSYIMKILESIRKKYNLKIAIALTSSRIEKKNTISKRDEIKFYERDVKKFYTSDKSSFELAAKSKLIISIHSTLGHELLFKGYKVLFLNPHKFYFNTNDLGYSRHLYFGSSEKKQIIKKIINTLNISNKVWEKKIIKFKKNNYDKNNSKIKNLINKLLIKK